MTASINAEHADLRQRERERIAEASRLLTLRQFCDITALAESTARQWIKTGRLRVVSGNSHHIRVPVSEIQRVFQPKVVATQGD